VPDNLWLDEATAANDHHFLRTFEIFRHHTFAFYLRKEVEHFIKHAKGKTRFVDVGSAEGYYSALFASICGEKAQIASIDGAVGCQASMRERVRASNLAHFKPKEWTLYNFYITDANGTLVFKPPRGIEVVTFVEAMNRLNFAPDLIKFDIESSEYEALLPTESVAWFKQHKPTVMLELHNKILHERGLSATPILESFSSIGYKIADTDTRNLRTQRRNVRLILTPA
jgi:FkbM family methyltransferase